MMPELHRVATTSEIPPGEMKVVEVNGEEIAIANCDGDYLAFQNACTHKQGPLGEGLLLDGCIVECPFHGGQFNARTGEVVAAPPTEPIATFPVQVDGDDISITV
jgi:nitrite reductase/ring-hydroxylating ferredoxin subunit